MEDKNILLIGFNRSDLILDNIKRLRKIKNVSIWIAIDGPRKNNKYDLKENKKIKKILSENNIRKTNYKFNKANLGCRKGVNNAISWFFENVNAGIIIEDDVEININYAEQMFLWLSQFENESKVCSISSHPSLKADFRLVQENGICLMPTCRVWGWATWKNRWIEHMENTNKIKNYSLARIFFLMPNKYRDFHSVLRIWYCLRNKFDTWDYEWNFFHILNNKYSITPNNFYSINHGFRKDGTHTTNIRNKPKYKLKKFSIQNKEKLKINNFNSKRLEEIVLSECGFPLRKNYILEILRLVKFLILNFNFKY